ncbi:unnamed protein product [Prunus armeniaca]
MFDGAAKRQPIARKLGGGGEVATATAPPPLRPSSPSSPHPLFSSPSPPQIAATIIVTLDCVFPWESCDTWWLMFCLCFNGSNNNYSGGSC